MGSFTENTLERCKVCSIDLFAKISYYLQLVRVTTEDTIISKVNWMSIKCQKENSQAYKTNSSRESSYVSIWISVEIPVKLKGNGYWLLTLSCKEKVPGKPAKRNLFFTFNFPKFATIRWFDLELSGMSRTGAPASISRRTREQRWAWSLT
jgi:hypothetical protein